MKVNGNSVEKLDRTLKGFNYLLENNEVTVISAEVEIEGENYNIEVDYEFDSGNAFWVVDFE